MNNISVMFPDMALHIGLSGTTLIVGIIGNVLTLTSILLKKTPNVRHHLYLTNLTAADLIILTLCMPLNFVGMYISWPFGRFVCKVLFPITDTVLAVSNITLVLIGLDRYRAVVTPLARKQTLRETKVLIAVVWIVSYIISSLPLTLIMDTGPGLWTEVSCDVFWPSPKLEKAHKLVNFIFLFCMPVLLNLVFYSRVAYKLEMNARKISARSDSKERQKQHRRLVWMMFLMFICFVLCLLPYHLFMLLATFSPGTVVGWNSVRTFIWASVLTLYTSSTINPIIYMIMSKEFQQFFHLRILRPIVFSFCGSVQCLTIFSRRKEENSLAPRLVHDVEDSHPQQD